MDPSLISEFDAQEWADKIRELLDRQLEIEVEIPPVSVFRVPETITTNKPEAYKPQHIGLGPYHHFEPGPYTKMEQKKLVVVQKILQYHNIKYFDFIVLKVQKLVPAIRACYEMFLEHDNVSMAWVFAIDGLFLLNIFETCSTNHPKADPTTKRLLAQDIMMVENQIPFMVLKEISEALQSSSGARFSPSIFRSFCEIHSPLELCSTLQAPTHVEHLLHYMYSSIINNVPKEEALPLPVSSVDSSVLSVSGIDSSALPVFGIDSSTFLGSGIDLSASPVSREEIYSARPSSVSRINPSASTYALRKSSVKPLSSVHSSALPTYALRKSSVRPLSSVHSSALPVSGIDSSASPVSRIDSSALPVSGIVSSALPVSSIGSSALLVSCIHSSVLPVSGIDSSALPMSSIDSSALSVSGIDSSALPISGIDSSTLQVSCIDSPALPVSRIDSPALPVSGIDSSALPVSRIDSPALAVSGIDSSALPVSGIDSSALPVSGIGSPALLVSCIDSSVLPVSGIDSSALPVFGDDLSALPISGVDSSSLSLSRIDPSSLSVSGIDTSTLVASRIDSSALLPSRSITSLSVPKIDSSTQAYSLLKSSFESVSSVDSLALLVSYADSSSLPASGIDSSTLSVTGIASPTLSLSGSIASSSVSRIGSSTSAYSPFNSQVDPVSRNLLSPEKPSSRNLHVFSVLRPVVSLVKKAPKNETVELYEQTISSLQNFCRNSVIIPSASELKCTGGFMFHSLQKDKGIQKIKIEGNNIYLPCVSLNKDSEVILRNLIAYETLIPNSNHFPLTEYMGLMCGLVVNVDDVKLLRKENIIKGDLSEDEVAKIFLEMSTSILSLKTKQKSKLQETIDKINKAYESSPRIRAYLFLKRLANWLMVILKLIGSFAEGTWKIVIVMISIVSLFMLTYQAYCDVYGCDKNNVTLVSYASS